MQAEMNMVREFHEKNGYDIAQPLCRSVLSETHFAADFLHIQSMSILSLVKTFQLDAIGAMKHGDSRLYRCLLILEELAEMMGGMWVNDEAMVLDALADLTYVVVGTAVTYGLPLPEAFMEVQRANMSKKKRDADADARMRDKGEGWTPPDMKAVIERSRSSQLCFKHQFDASTLLCVKCGISHKDIVARQK